MMIPEVARRLEERLSQISSVARFDKPGEPQSATLTHALTDLEDSFREILDVLLPKLLDESLSSEQLDDVLFDIREELRYILQHIKDPKYFACLLDD